MNNATMIWHAHPLDSSLASSSLLQGVDLYLVSTSIANHGNITVDVGDVFVIDAKFPSTISNTAESSVIVNGGVDARGDLLIAFSNGIFELNQKWIHRDHTIEIYNSQTVITGLIDQGCLQIGPRSPHYQDILPDVPSLRVLGSVTWQSISVILTVNTTMFIAPSSHVWVNGSLVFMYDNTTQATPSISGDENSKGEYLVIGTSGSWCIHGGDIHLEIANIVNYGVISMPNSNTSFIPVRTRSYINMYNHGNLSMPGSFYAWGWQSGACDLTNPYDSEGISA
jgi:hypothetical protein